MNEKLKILHLSDLHLKAGDASQDIVIDSMCRKLTSLFKDPSEKPDVLIISGDIAFSGKEKEYETALSLIDTLKDTVLKETSEIFVVPGNHDVERSKIEKAHLSWWYKFNDEESLLAILRLDESFLKINEKLENYFNFYRKISNPEVVSGRYGEYNYVIPNLPHKVKIIGLNSSLFCGYDKDDARNLAFGLDQVNNCEKIIGDDDFVITCFHHPFECYNNLDNPSINTIKRFSNIILTGHLHVPNTSSSISINEGKTVYVSAGASYEKRTSENSFNLIDLDFSKGEGKVMFYKYLSGSHCWIENKDINHSNNGIFPFEIPKTNYADTIATTTVDISNIEEENVPKTFLYEAVISVSYNELKRDTVDATINHIRNIVGDDNILITKVMKGSTIIQFTSFRNIASNISEIVFEDGSKIESIRFIDEISSTNTVDQQSLNWIVTLNREFENKINFPGASFTHNRKDELTLTDIWVTPNLKQIEASSKNNITSADEVFVLPNETEIKCIIYGDDGSGKSSLIQWYYAKYYQNGFVPVVIPGNSIKEISVDGLKKLARKQFQVQYKSSLTISFLDIPEDKIIIFIDDFHRVRFLKPKYKEILWRNISKAFKNLVITGNQLMKLENVGSKSLFTGAVGEFSKYEIIEYGPTLRYEIIKKWNGIGLESLSPNELVRLNNDSESHIDSIIGKNFVPSFPLYLLTILQAREGLNGSKPDYSLHGFYYEHLINEALSKAVTNKDDISLYFNYITEYSFFLFREKLNGSPIHILDFHKFNLNYCEDYNVKLNPQTILDTFVKARIISLSEDYISIPYKYVYYFFVARYLSNNIGHSEIRNIVSSLCQRVHRDEFSSIILFLTHLSKDHFITEELLRNSRELFADIQPVKLEDDVKFINELVQQLPEHVYEPLDIEKVKEEELKDEEELETQEKEFDKDNDVVQYDLNEDISDLDILSRMLKAVKTMELIGQVTKKYWGELKAQQKYDLAEETYLLGLRVLGFNFEILAMSTEVIEEYLTYVYKKQNKKGVISKTEINRASKEFMFQLSVMSSYGIIKKITTAIGYDRLADTFKQLKETLNATSVDLIDVSIKLEHTKTFPWNELKSISESTNKNHLSKSVLKNLVLNYLYVFHTTIEERQKICAMTDIKIEEQRYIAATSKVKKG